MNGEPGELYRSSPRVTCQVVEQSPLYFDTRRLYSWWTHGSVLNFRTVKPRLLLISTCTKRHAYAQFSHTKILFRQDWWSVLAFGCLSNFGLDSSTRQSSDQVGHTLAFLGSSNGSPTQHSRRKVNLLCLADSFTADSQMIFKWPTAAPLVSHRSLLQ